MHFKELIRKLSDRLRGAITRFPVCFTSSAVFSLTLIYFIISEEFNDELIVAFMIELLVSVLAEIAHEYGLLKIHPAIPSIISLTGSYLILHFFHENDYVVMAMVGLCLVLLFLIMALLYAYNDEKKLLSWLVRSALFSAVATGVVFSGLLVCLMAFYLLIYEFEDLYKYISILFIICEFTGLFNLFLSYIPHAHEELEISHSYRTVVHKVLFYVYALLVAILYLYIAKIIVTWTMPVGVLNWFGSITLLFYVFFSLSISEEDGKLHKWFRRYGALAIVPVLAVQLYAIFIRLSAYGLTSIRYLSLALIVIAVGFMVVALADFKKPVAFIIGAVVMAVITMTPANLLDIPNYSQEKILKQAIEETGIYVDGEVKNVSLTDEQIERLKGAYDYLRYSSGTKSDYVTALIDSDLRSVLYQYTYKNTISLYHSLYYDSSFTVDISGYRTMDAMEFRSGDDVGGYDCMEFFLEIMREYHKTGEEPDGNVIYFPDSQTQIVFLNFSIEYNIDDDAISYADGVAYIFRK